MAHDARPDGETDMTADNIAPEDVPPRDPANTELGPSGHGYEKTHDEKHDEKEDER